MYNGIGLSSVRGSSTSGHVQTNRGHVGASRLRRQQQRNAQDSGQQKYNPVPSAARKQGNTDIQKHEERRRIENQLLELQEEMEDGGQLNDEEIEERIGRERKRLMQRLEDKANSKPHFNNNNNNNREARGQRWDRQKTAGNHVLKKQQNDRLGSALGIQQDAHVEGQAFDRELQDQKKAERQAKMDKERKAAEEEEKKRKKVEKAEAKKRAKSEKKKKRRYSSSSSSDSSSDESKGSLSDSSSSTDRSDRKRTKHRRSPSDASSNRS
jgi:serine/arginine repetitive matrix protein 2